MSDKQPRVSVVIPVYNGSGTLEKCLRAVYDTAYPDVEVIVVDDGSTDDSPEIAGRFPLKLLKQKNQGPGPARNTGVAASTGEFILFIDCDCISEPDLISKMMAEFRRLEGKHPELAAIGGRVLPNPRYLDRCVAYAEYYPWQVEEEYVFNHLSTCMALVRREDYDRVGGFIPTLDSGEDRHFFHLIHRAGRTLVYTPKVSILHDHPRTSLGAFLTHSYGWGKRQGLELELEFQDIRGTGYLRHIATPLRYALMVLPISAAITLKCVLTNLRFHPAVLLYAPVIFLSKVWYRAGVAARVRDHPERTAELRSPRRRGASTT